MKQLLFARQYLIEQGVVSCRGDIDRRRNLFLGVGEAEFSRLLRWRKGAKQQYEKKLKTNDPKLEPRILPAWHDSKKRHHATDYKQWIESLSTFSRLNPPRAVRRDVKAQNTA